MDRLLVISTVLQVIAALWSAVLLWRSRDWRFGFLTLVFSLMALRRVLDLAGANDPGRGAGAVSLKDVVQFIVLLISVLSVAAVGFLHMYWARREEHDSRVQMLASALADSSAPVLILSVGDEGMPPRVVFVSDTICALSGYLRHELIGQTPRLFEGPETAVDFIGAIRRCAKLGESAVVEAVKYRKTGEKYWASCALSPVRDRAGRVTHVLWFQTDITARRKADAALHDALQKLSFHMDNSPLGVIEWDRDFRVARWSSGAERIFGWTASEVLGKHPNEWPIVYHEDAEGVAKVIERLHRGVESRNLWLNRNTTKSGEVIWCQWYNSVLFDPDGRVNSIHSLAQDVTDRQRSAERQRLLMLELDHRVKNNLTTVMGIAQQTLSASATLGEFGEAFMGRVEALARAHGLLAKASWEGVNLEALCERILESGLVGRTPPISLEGPTVTLSASQGSILALTLHELMTNALKYGSLSVPAGRVAVRWSMDDTGDFPILTLDWVESGGPPVQLPVKEGFGVEFIRTGVSYELHGEAEVTYDGSGLRCRLIIPNEVAKQRKSRAQAASAPAGSAHDHGR
jgi:PAS domain S-box-containing protein